MLKPGIRSSTAQFARSDPPPLLERRREILAGQAKGRMLATLKQGGESPAEVNLPQREDKTRDSIAAEIGVSNIRSRTPAGNP